MFEIINKCYKFDDENIYKIIYSIELDDKKVYYLINIKDFGDIKFCYSYDEEIYEEIKDIEVLKEVVNKMSREAAVFLQ